ncbi:VTT domain-containing protein [Rhodobacteraceae bacterium M382]|nr:VTT domain-containing protein [Rhodobacteraceae bacterium M382]
MIGQRLFRRTVLITAVLAGSGAFLWWWYFGQHEGLLTRGGVEQLVGHLGRWGPALIIGLMTLAVVASPIPSAPIALASGAVYGHFSGTIYVLIGAELGALIAFTLGRALGRETLQRWFSTRIDAGLLGSQNALMLMVFVSRLLPFVSFDLVSYAAGLSCLQFWRFAVATLAGIIPASFFLAHLGGEAAAGNAKGAILTALILGLATGIPLLWIAIRPARG